VIKKRTRDFLVSKILSGVSYFKVKEKIYKIVNPSSEIRYLGEYLADLAGDQFKFRELMTREEAKEALHQRRIWTPKDDESLTEAENNLEDFKVDLFKSQYNEKAKKTLRNRIKGTNKAISEAVLKRDSLDHATIENYTEVVRDQFCVAMSIEDMDRVRYYNPNDFFDQNSFLMETGYSVWRGEMGLLGYCRELCRTDPWRSYWNSSSNSDVFGKPSSELTMMQRTMVAFSKMYDNARQSPEAPSDEVFDDDDMFDGWMILQRREQQKKKDKETADKISGQKGDEIYMMANSHDDAQKIYGVNDTQGRMTIKNRESQIKSAGGNIVKEDDLRDVKMKIRKELSERLKRG
jgi:hypothetical protein|tara:strand:- start:103 stop:1149 length:1047 start_codon:yes stop_codon:yes gene_type:complete